MTPEPFVMAWYRSMPQKPGDRRCRCVVTRVGIAGGALHEIARFTSQTSVIKAIAMGNNTIFLAFENQGLTVVRSQGVERYDEARRAPPPTSTPWPGWTARSIVALSGAIARFDPADGKFTMIASSKAVKESSPLDGGMPYRVQSILADPGRHCLWLSIGGNKRDGLWKYAPRAEKFEKVSPKTGNELFWSDGRIFFLAQERDLNWHLYCLDPATLKLTNRRGSDGWFTGCRIPPTWSVMDGRLDLLCRLHDRRRQTVPLAEVSVEDHVARSIWPRLPRFPGVWGRSPRLWYVERRQRPRPRSEQQE